MYKNSSFIKRFVANIIDLVLSLLLIILLFYLISFSNKNNQEISKFSFYGGFVLIIICINVFYLIIPIIIKGRTFGLLIMKLIIIDSGTKKFTIKMILLRNVFVSFYLTFVMLFIMIFLSEKSFVVVNERGHIFLKIRDDIYHKIVLQVVVILLSIIFSIYTFGYLFNIFKANRLSIIDFLTSSRIVENKKYTKNSIVKFTPIYYEKRKFRYISNKN
ncbi:RDD family protein [Mycoplasmopsis cynos]|uniref:RDD family protein n=1 Tax=Mycoplasmopsis cynos TaxID=171284 RepID=A0ABD8AIE8_9BACT|nr:RDD family protein [Mycoplasmopsis cynos]MCU9935479.1 RDD family protein [Mycoplasmopsis cynos]UWV80313.1 RDD family protein [Mycoplasmopsis cynos]UWV85752.1 RDD family protein [Mycoplasmopsis cynos]WAM05794.1 RDD family protein [Mycoplasmopsis cynos]WAM08922.1 RDD family protein [Mycoplasmopsis cynos]